MSALAQTFSGAAARDGSESRGAAASQATDGAPEVVTGARGWRQFLDTRGMIAAFCIAAVAINTVLVVINARAVVSSALSRSAGENADAADGFEQYTRGIINTAEATARFVAREYATAGATIDLGALRDAGLIDPTMYSAAHVFDASGVLIASVASVDSVTGQRREFPGDTLTPHPEDGSTKIHLGKPFNDTTTGAPVVPISWRFAPTGAFGGGIVVLEVPSARFTAFRAHAGGAEAEVLLLVGADGIARARRIGRLHTAGENFARGPLFSAMQRQSSGDVLAPSPIDGERRLFSYRMIDGHPLIVAAGLSEAAAIGDASRTARSYYVRAGVLTAIISLLAGCVIGALTRRKRAVAQLRTSEMALRRREEELRTLTESMPQLVWIAARDGSLTFFNRQWQDYTGVSAAESLEDHWRAALHPQDQPAVAERWEQCIARGELFEMEYRLRSAEGVFHWMLGRALPIRNDRGEVTKWCGTATNIDNQIAAQEQVRKQAELLNLTDDAIIVREVGDTIRFWNRGAEKLYGWPAADVIGRKARDFDFEDAAEVVAIKVAVEHEGQWAGELKQLTRGGDAVFVTSRWTSVPGELGSSNSILIVNRDVTERRKAEQQLLRAHRLESIGTLASGVAHDLNNVLAPVLLAAPLLRKDLPVERRDRLVSLIEQSAERGASIVMQVLTFARGADGERILLQPTHLVKQTVSLLEETFPKTIQVEAVYPEHVWLIEADSTQLHQVLLNLCVNARDAMPEGGILSLSVQNFEVDENYASMTPGAKAGPHVLIEVRDTGTGIPQHVIDKIYDPFFTTKGVGKGTGLGLSTVLGIVNSHGGVITAASSADGTTFRILLPAAVHANQTEDAVTAKDLPQGSGETILMVDDEPAVLEIAETLLVNNGYKVLLAEDGPSALALFADLSDEIDLVLTDLAMPIMNGIALARTLRRMDREARIVISTGREDDFKPAQLVEIGVAGTLPKPYSQSALLHLLRQVLHREEVGV